MGLTVSSGDYAYLLAEEPEDAEWMEEDFVAINAVLKSHHLATHSEPTEEVDFPMESIEGFPYSFLHYLRRIYALDRLGQPITPVDDELTDEDDAMIEQASELMDSHLLCHSDAEGYYVPIDFAEVIFDDDLPGGMLGSSQRLYAEILNIAHHIGIEVVADDISESSKADLSDTEEDHPYFIERMVWFTLYENCKNSIQNNTVIAFC